jgi:hypothetical protein
MLKYRKCAPGAKRMPLAAGCAKACLGTLGPHRPSPHQPSSGKAGRPSRVDKAMQLRYGSYDLRILVWGATQARVQRAPVRCALPP